MKNLFKNLAVLSAIVSIGMPSVYAASNSKQINANACETVYTNYYLLVETNTEDYLLNQTNPLNLVHENRGVFVNNVWRTDFDPNNIGYGEISVQTYTDTSSDRLTSWSLRDFYNYMLLTEDSTNGNYIDGNNTYIFNHYYEKKNAAGNWENQGYGFNMNLRPYTTTQYINATYNTNTSISAVSPINNSTNDLTIYINRTHFTDYANRAPIVLNNNKWLYDPAVYYIQYCKPKAEEKYLVYDKNTTDTVTNMPNKQSYNTATITLSPQVPVRTGYKFLGWTTKQVTTVTDVLYTPSSIYSDASTIVYAQWEKETPKEETPVKNTYRITYNGNASGVVDVPEDTVKYEDEDAKIATKMPSLTGYTFLGWNTDPKATEGLKNYNPGSAYKDRKNLDLYAIWRKNEVVNPTPLDNKIPTPTNDNNKNLPENPYTGVEDYILPVSGVSLVSLIGLSILKKKRTFIKF